MTILCLNVNYNEQDKEPTFYNTGSRSFTFDLRRNVGLTAKMSIVYIGWNAIDETSTFAVQLQFPNVRTEQLVGNVEGEAPKFILGGTTITPGSEIGAGDDRTRIALCSKACDIPIGFIDTHTNLIEVVVTPLVPAPPASLNSLCLLLKLEDDACDI